MVSMIDKVKISLDKGARMPERAHSLDAGADLFTPVSFHIKPRCSYKIDTGVHIEIPEGYVGFLKSKSGLNVKQGIISTGTIDAGYTGSIVVKLYNLSDTTRFFDAGNKITQLVILPIATPEFEIVDKLDDTERGDGGFGSTGA